MREILNKYGAMIAGGVIVLAIIYLVLASRGGKVPGGDSTKGFFIDEETQEESILAASEIPPLMGKNRKPTVVRAFKYSCDSGKDPKIFYLSKYTDQAQQELQTLSVDDPRRADVANNGELVRAPEPGSEWIPVTDQKAAAIRVLPDCPGGGKVVLVSP